MDRIELNMVYSKSTKNKHVLVEGEGNLDVEAVQALYISRIVFAGHDTVENLQGRKFRLVIEEAED